MMPATNNTETATKPEEQLLCDEDVAIATPVRSSTPPRKPLSTDPKEKHSPAHVTAPSEFEVCPWEVMTMRLEREATGDYTRDGNYLKDVQTHGMDATWRFKMCRWMFETAKAFDLSIDSVGYAIHFMDQYLSEHSVDKILLQLLCMVCMFVASKMHETQPITMEEMELLCEHKFTRDQILSVESTLLRVLNWKLTPPTAFTFARDFMGLIEMDDDVKESLEAATIELVQAAAEEYSSVKFSSSILGVSAVKLAARHLRVPSLDCEINKTLAEFTFEPRHLIDCNSFLRRFYAATSVVPVSPSKSPNRIDSPTSVDEFFEPRQPKASKALKRLIDAVDSSETSPPSPERENDASPKRTRHQ